VFDGFKINDPLQDIEAWKTATKIDFSFYREEKTNERTPRKKRDPDFTYKTYIGKSNFETYELEDRETHKENTKGQICIHHRLIIEGSLHKNFYGGSNYQPFTWQDLQKEIAYLQKKLYLEDNSKFDNLEIGVNILTPFAAFPFLQKNLILYLRDSFIQYEPDKNGIILGYQSPQTQYVVKIYDKGLQNNLPYHLLRFEVKFKKMEKLNKIGIRSISDLKDITKVKKCIRLILKAWDNVLLFDYDIDIENPELTKFQRDLLINGKDRTHWEILKKTNLRTFKDHKRKFRELVLKYGNNYHSLIREKIEIEWDSLINNQSTLPTLTEKEVSNLTIKVKCHNGHYRKCLSCGKDISHQRKGSKYCSEKLNGKEGKRCRNRASNPRNNHKRYLDRNKGKLFLFDVEPYIIQRKGRRA
jgi:hypothetical protein